MNPSRHISGNFLKLRVLRNCGTKQKSIVKGGGEKGAAKSTSVAVGYQYLFRLMNYLLTLGTGWQLAWVGECSAL